MTNLSLVECRKQCEIQMDALTGRLCYSFDYNPSAELCSLNSNDANIAYETQRIQDEDWNHYNYSRNGINILLLHEILSEKKIAKKKVFWVLEIIFML